MLRDQPMLKSEPSRILQPGGRGRDHPARASSLPDRAMVSELDIRPTNP